MGDSTAGDDSSVVGYVLSTKDEDLFKQKLALFDHIEGYRVPGARNNFYDRTIVDVDLLPTGKQKAESVKAYVYHGTHFCSRSNLIPSGDWLKRTR